MLSEFIITEKDFSQSEARLLNRDFLRNRDSIMILDEITDSLICLLKVNYKTDKIFISVESLYYFKENQNERKRSDRHIHYKIPPKSFERVQSPKCGILPIFLRIEQKSARLHISTISWRTALILKRTKGRGE